MPNTARLAAITQRARDDPAFFKALVRSPLSALKKIGEDWPEARDGSALSAMLDYLSACSGGETCSCTSGTCGGTCGGATCDVTCSGGSCGRTCDNSCGYTTNLAGDALVRRVRPALRGIR
jgi:hypothetical protein